MRMAIVAYAGLPHNLAAMPRRTAAARHEGGSGRGSAHRDRAHASFSCGLVEIDLIAAAVDDVDFRGREAAIRTTDGVCVGVDFPGAASDIAGAALAGGMKPDHILGDAARTPDGQAFEGFRLDVAGRGRRGGAASVSWFAEVP